MIYIKDENLNFNRNNTYINFTFPSIKLEIIKVFKSRRLRKKNTLTLNLTKLLI